MLNREEAKRLDLTVRMERNTKGGGSDGGKGMREAIYVAPYFALLRLGFICFFTIVGLGAEPARNGKLDLRSGLESGCIDASQPLFLMFERIRWSLPKSACRTRRAFTSMGRVWNFGSINGHA